MLDTAFDMSVPPGRFVEKEDEAKEWIKYFLHSHKANNGLGIDSETTGLSRLRDRVLFWSLSDGEYRICLPVELIQLFREPILENPEINFDFTNAPYDAHMFANSGANLLKAGEWRDTRIQSFLVNENNFGRHGLKDTIHDHFGRVTPSFEQTFGKVPPRKIDKRTGRNLNKTVGDLVRELFADPARRELGADYASLDAYNSTTLRAHFDRLLAGLEISPGYTLKDYYYATEVPFTKLLWKMERRGVTVDRGHLQEQRGPMELRMSAIESEIGQYCGRLLNLNSVVDVRWFFFEFLGKEVVKMTSGGTTGEKNPSVDFDVLDKWAGQGDPWATKLIEYRSIAKIYGTYVMGLQEWLDPNYRIHTSFNQIGAVTMRLSSSEPNLQNIPRPGEDVYKIRDAFIASAGKCLIVADYEQLEMRLMAHFSRDEKMINAIKGGIDLHCLTVSEMYGIPYDDVMAAKKAEKKWKEGKGPELTAREEELLFYRQAAKATGFGIIYGIGGEHLAANLTKELKKLVTPQEGFQLIEKWFNVFPGVRNYINATKNEIWKTNKVQTLVGRWRNFGELRTMSKRDASQCERQAVNSVVQGTASDIVKQAMLRVDRDPEMNLLGTDLLLQIHDELYLECPDENLEVVKRAKARVAEIMAQPFDFELEVPIPVSAGSGYTWASAK